MVHTHNCCTQEAETQELKITFNYKAHQRLHKTQSQEKKSYLWEALERVMRDVTMVTYVGMKLSKIKGTEK